MYNVAFFCHILGVLAFVSGITVAGVAFEAARRRERPAEIALLLGLSRIRVLLVAARVLLAGVFGLWLVHLGRWGYGSAWVDASIALFLLALAIGGHGGRRPKRARELAAALAASADTGQLVSAVAGADASVSAAQHGEAAAQLRALLDDRVTRWENYLSLMLVVAIIALMCFKP